MSKACKIVPAAIITAAALAAGQSADAQDPGQAMLLLHSDQYVGLVEAALPQLADQGCSLWRRGAIAEANGNLDVGKPDQFLLFSCGADVLANSEQRQVLAPIIAADKHAAAIEGPLLFRNSGDAPAETLLERDYFFKLSHFNNDDPDRREQELTSINTDADGRTDTWQREAIFAGTSAIGMPTPDTIDVIFYDNAEQGERFRDQNPDMLKLIGGFNKDHLTQFTYINGSLSE